MDVRLGRIEGRGDIWVDEQPDSHNDFTAIIGVHDPHPGSAWYRFVLEW